MSSGTPLAIPALLVLCFVAFRTVDDPNIEYVFQLVITSSLMASVASWMDSFPGLCDSVDDHYSRVAADLTPDFVVE